MHTESGRKRREVEMSASKPSRSSARADSSKSAPAARSARARLNKIYRTPPTPPPPRQAEQERGFTLDCIAVNSISSDYYRTNPKLGPVVPPYNSQHDRHTKSYFSNIGVDQTLRRSKQSKGGCSLDGPVMDAFFTTGKGHQYLSFRNVNGVGHSKDYVSGHGQFMKGILPLIGYNGKFGFRRNTPWLRTTPSPFGTGSTSPCY